MTSVSDEEIEVARAAGLIAEIVEARQNGNFDELRGNSDEDLLAAIEDLEDAIRSWRSG